MSQIAMIAGLGLMCLSSSVSSALTMGGGGGDGDGGGDSGGGDSGGGDSGGDGGGDSAEEPQSVNAYEFIGAGHCKGTAIYGSPAWELLESGEPQTRGTAFEGDPVFEKYLNRAQVKCDENPNCKYVSVWKNAGYRTYREGDCSERWPASQEATWEKA
jgi:hypothetical protein